MVYNYDNIIVVWNVPDYNYKLCLFHIILIGYDVLEARCCNELHN